MVDCVITPSGNGRWTIYEKPSEADLGYIQHAPSGFLVLANKDNLADRTVAWPLRLRKRQWPQSPES